jgi:hypothetical protein
MTQGVPKNPKLYHIVHVDRLPSILAEGGLWCDAVSSKRRLEGTTIGFPEIKARRLERKLVSYPDLSVGDCVPFYFCPRSVMLYIIYKRNHANLRYKDGQVNIIHLETTLFNTVEWANENQKRWVFTSANAGAFYCEDYNDLSQLNQINWQAVNATSWSQVRDPKQAEFLFETFFPWHLVESIGVCTAEVLQSVKSVLEDFGSQQPHASIRSRWYY